jgi:hypothetical protein
MNALVRVEQHSLKVVRNDHQSSVKDPAQPSLNQTSEEASLQKATRKAIPKSPRPVTKRKNCRARKTDRQAKSRDDLSFTARVHREDFPDHPLLNNWLPVSVPTQENQWNIGRDIGLKMINELADLASDNEVDAFDAIQFAFNSPTWKVGGHGVETGFSEGIAALAILGLRHLALGGLPFDPESPKPAIYWTAKRIIEKQTKEVKKTTGPLRDLYDGRAQGMIMALCSVGLIDNETYMKCFDDLAELTDKRRSRTATAQER